MKTARKICFTRRPDAIEKVHLSFLEVGCDVIETNSFGGGEVVLTEFGIAEKAYDVNLRSPRSSRKQLANDFSTKEKPRFVAGSIGPGNKTADARAHHLSRF